MDKLRDLQNKRKAKKKKKIFLKRPKERTTDKPITQPELTSESDAEGKKRNPELRGEAKNSGKRKIVQITNNTQNFDPSDFLKKINPSMLVFLKKKNLEPILQEEGRKPHEPNTVYNDETSTAA